MWCLPFAWLSKHLNPQIQLSIVHEFTDKKTAPWTFTIIYMPVVVHYQYLLLLSPAAPVRRDESDLITVGWDHLNQTKVDHILFGWRILHKDSTRNCWYWRPIESWLPHVHVLKVSTSCEEPFQRTVSKSTSFSFFLHLQKSAIFPIRLSHFLKVWFCLIIFYL